MTMNNTKTKTAFGEVINDIRAYICDARDDRFDLQEARLGLRRAKNAVKNMGHGQLDTPSKWPATHWENTTSTSIRRAACASSQSG